MDRALRGLKMTRWKLLDNRVVSRSAAAGAPLQIQRRQGRRDAGATKVKAAQSRDAGLAAAESIPSRRGYFCSLADCSWSVSDLCQLESGLNFAMALTSASVFLPRSFS